MDGGSFRASGWPAIASAYRRTILNVDLIIVLVIVLVIVVIWRGPKTIPELGRMFGRGVREARIEANTLRSDADQPGPTDETSTPR
jgi:Sec-independent protein translocase protein TatA